MFIPIGDTPNPPGRPVVNYALIAVNIAVFAIVTLPLSYSAPDPRDPALLQYIQSIPAARGYPLQAILQSISAYDLFLFKHAYKAASPGVTPLMLSMFLHGGWMHLIGNMLFLWIYGDNVEYRLGSARYLFAYLSTGAAATLFYSLFSSHSTIPMIGASGAISGVLGFYFIWFPKNRVKVMMLLFPFFMDVILLPARLVLGFFLVIDNLLPFLLSPKMGGGVAHGAHIGGFLAGLAVAYGLDRISGEAPSEPSEKEIPSWKSPFSRTVQTEESPERVRTLISQRNLNGAVRTFLSLASTSERLGVGPDDIMRLGDYLLQNRRYEEALTLFRRYIGDYPAGPYLDWACLGAGLAILHGRGEAATAYQYFLQVLDASPSPKAEQEARRQIASLDVRSP